LRSAEKGYDATTIRQIAKAATVNEASIYIYFDSKEDILNEILEAFWIMPKSHIIPKSRIDAYLTTDTQKQLLTRFIPSCKEEDVSFINRAYHIAYREQFVNEKAKELVQAHLIGEAAESLEYALEKLMESGKVPGIISKTYSVAWMCRQFSKVWVDTMFTLLCRDGFPEPGKKGCENEPAFMGLYLIDMAITEPAAVSKTYIQSRYELLNPVEKAIGY